ncbi:MAG TPA: O-antigen ligase family protein [Ktedonobacteraceae bacterium]|nr:O-antigen ligase family protein [Ktedonobacteraceae bacterium]
MSSKELASASSDAPVSQPVDQPANQGEQDIQSSQPPDLPVKESPSDSPPADRRQPVWKRSPFWRDRLVEAGMVCSMAAYYVVGNNYLGASKLFHLNPFVSLPFLLIFAVLSWYRLSFAVALLPMAVPYYFLEKPVYSHYEFELAEIALGVCVGIALIQVFLRGKHWTYWLSWREMRARVGLFVLPIAIFVVAAGVSVLISFAHKDALRAFREEVFDPLVFLLLALYCLRERQDVTRLLLALFGAAFLIALEGVAQYTLFKHTLALDSDGRVHAIFGSANNIGLFFDYSLPIGLALVIIGRRNLSNSLSFLRRWGARLLVLAMLLPMLAVLYLSQSRGSWVAIALAAILIVLLALRSRKLFIISGLALLAVCVAVAAFFHQQIIDFFVLGHVDTAGISTVTKRIYLWESALRIIRQYPVFGVGLDNWLCYYSRNTICVIPSLHQHYWITLVPGTNIPTGLNEEPNLSHPHNIFLHVWVSIGIFGLLAFIALIALFYRLFARVLKTVRALGSAAHPDLEWMVIGVGAAMLAGLIQGQVDSAFLAQDMAFCFWMLVTALLLLRVLTNTPWRGRIQSVQQE